MPSVQGNPSRHRDVGCYLLAGASERDALATVLADPHRLLAGDAALPGLAWVNGEAGLALDPPSGGLVACAGVER